MTEELLFTHFLNKYFGAIAIKILAALGAHPVTAGENKAYLFTYNPAVPLGLAIVAWLYYHWHGIRKQGVLTYAKHFTGPMPILAPLMIPIEIISHIARMMSLTIRLYANIFAGDLVTLVFFSLIPI